MTEYIQAGKFKARCLKLMDKVHRTKRKIIITKRNKPIAQLVPIEKENVCLFGKMKGTVHVIGDNRLLSKFIVSAPSYRFLQLD